MSDLRSWLIIVMAIAIATMSVAYSEHEVATAKCPPGFSPRWLRFDVICVKEPQ